MNPRRIGLALTLVVLVASGAYLLLYLYRWEWNRALVSGMFFISAEVALVATTVLGRLEAIERRLAQLAARPPSALDLAGREHDRLGDGFAHDDVGRRGSGGQPHDGGHPLDGGHRDDSTPVADRGPADEAAPTQGATPLDRIREAAPRSRPFAWLDARDGRTNVFVPVLMGAGVVLSALAYLVERLAGATAGAAAERGLAGHVSMLSLPSGALATAGGRRNTLAPGALRGVVTPKRRTGPERARRAVAGLMLTLLTVAAIQVLADGTQNRPDPTRTGLTTTVDLVISHRKGPRPVQLTAEAIWVACRTTLPARIEATSIVGTGTNTARLLLTPAIGEHGRRRFQGCVEDALFDKVSARITALRTAPS